MKVTTRIKNSIGWIFLAIAVTLMCFFLVYSNRLAQLLGKEERAKVELWATAYQQLITAEEQADMTLELKVMADNTTIPVFYTDADGTLLGSSNIVIPSDTSAFLKEKIRALEAQARYFDIPLVHQRLYYDESTLLQLLRYYPYFQVLIILVLILLLYYMVVSRRESEQNRVWVGLSKETAHQLGTPIQSLMGWAEYLRSSQESPLEEGEMQNLLTEIDKDISRLRVVADRFSKIGSAPQLVDTDLCDVLRGVVTYMEKRASHRISMVLHCPQEAVRREVSAPLLSWVVENLLRNAIDAQPTVITVTLLGNGSIEVADNGKGIAKNLQRTIFEAGFTTKQRGWGLGLALSRRIIEQYHHGRIYVKESTPGEGTVFRIDLKRAKR